MDSASFDNVRFRESAPGSVSNVFTGTKIFTSGKRTLAAIRKSGLEAAVSCEEHEGPLWAVPVQAGKVCNHRASPNRHLSSIPRNGYSPANMQCAARATARRDPLVDGKLEHQLMTAFEKIHPSFPSAVQGPQWAVRVRRAADGADVASTSSYTNLALA